MYGCSKVLEATARKKKWDEFHHLGGGENHLLPKNQRTYFSPPQTEEELREDLGRMTNMTSMLKRMDQEEEPKPRPTPISSDAGPPVIPSKHEVGGSMRDHDREVVPWNNRHGMGIGNVANDGMHHLHREYFSQPSLFAEAPSQRWRRCADVEVERGVWKPIKPKASRRSLQRG